MLVAGILGLLFLLLFLAVPVAFAMLIAGIVGLYLAGGAYPVIGVLKSGPYEHVASYTLSTLPMFVLMAELMSASNITRDLFRAANGWLGHLRGGLAYAAVSGGVLLAAVCGSSSAAAATLASAIHPEMRRYGYSASFSAGALAAVGTLAIMIPPSIALVLYGILTETSVGLLLIAGLLPGLLTALAYIVTIQLIARLRPASVARSQPRVPMAQRLRTSLPALPMFLLLGAMITLIYSGTVTPTEVGALGALCAFAIALTLGRLGRRSLSDAVFRATRSSAMILCIVAFSAVFAVFLTLSGAPQTILALVQGSGLSPVSVLLLVLAVLLVLGIFLDQIAILIITMPLIFPLMTGLGYDPIWLGIIVVKTAEIGLLTPPVGLNLFILSATAKVPVATVARGVTPFVIAELIVLALLVAFPQIALWLPGLSNLTGG
ncbi:TRAP transporter, DctM subunit [Tistlia consotensis]|uniref:TRAP transporter large permease protein n=1 Tax=Tistlia consotensis USBA 355 TaxID=560819 RepID=A0A1Y6CEE5_9PROT|nr:TRAP transporter large permease [Tistlia consotensis]SMF57089.1 TRAP transporter, DctM subunit [Tistlia consotensis USBA 355]SNR45340.1 TRAP transporter, DctM subunit [Tistlia consotensis]